MSSFISAIMPILQPSNFLILLLIIGLLIRALSRDSRLAAMCIKFSLSVLILISLLPLHHWMFLPLENRFPAPELPTEIDGIIVLGGPINPQLTQSRNQLSLNEYGERLTEAVRLAQRYPNAKLAYTGGKWLPEDTLSDADAALRFFTEQGLDPTRIIAERQATNTYENAQLSHALVSPTPEDTWILVTSASHIPRSMGVFRQIGWTVIAYPVDYRTHPEGLIWKLNVSYNIRMFDNAARSWLALAGYYLRGRTAKFFPAP